jgi:uncharacterized protein (TIGR03437 family)
MTGLGAVKQPVTAGAAAPGKPLARPVNPVNVYIEGLQANVAFAGLEPTLGGLYKVNVTIPSGLAGGNYEIGIETNVIDAAGDLSSDFISFEATIPIGP